MGDERQDDDQQIHKMDTVPPPDGGKDVYDAPTRMGPVTSDAWAQLIRDADREADAISHRTPASGEPKSVRASFSNEVAPLLPDKAAPPPPEPVSRPAVPRPTRPSRPAAPASGPVTAAASSAADRSSLEPSPAADPASASSEAGVIETSPPPCIYDYDDEDEAATLLHQGVKPSGTLVMPAAVTLAPPPVSAPPSFPQPMFPSAIPVAGSAPHSALSTGIKVFLVALLAFSLIAWLLVR